MTSRERILATFEGKQTDRIPVHHLGFSGQAASVILGREAYVGGQIQQWREMRALWGGPEAHQKFLDRSERDAFDVAVAADHDILRLQYWRWSVVPARKIDEYTFLFGDPDGDWYTMRFDPDIELFHRREGFGDRGRTEVAPREPADAVSGQARSLEALEADIRRQEEEMGDGGPPGGPDPHVRSMIESYPDYVVRVGGGTAGIPYTEVWLEATAARPDLVARHVELQAQRACGELARVAASGAKLVFAGTDFASNEGPMYSPRAFRELMLPGLRKITAECHRLGMYYLIASDGNLWPVADDLFGESGVDGYYEIDRRAGMDLGELRRRFPHLTLIGNVSSHTVHLGTEKEVESEVLSCVEVAQEYGGVIIGVSNYVMPGTPRENIETMLETIRRYR